MTFDAALAVRILNNGRQRTAQSWGEYRDLGGALVVTSDAPIDALNCMVDFTSDDRRIESLLDIGFALLRAFDRLPAAELTPLDRPRSLAKRLARRGLERTGGKLEMVFRGDIDAVHVNKDVRITVAEPEDARTFADIHGGTERWARRLSLSSTMAGILEPNNTFYIGSLEGQPAGVTHLLRDGATAGIYAVSTLKAQRGHGVATTLIARAVRDAQAAGCDVISIGTDLDNPARSIYEAMGFEAAFETQLWTAPG